MHEFSVVSINRTYQSKENIKKIFSFKKSRKKSKLKKILHISHNSHPPDPVYNEASNTYFSIPPAEMSYVL